MPDALHAVLLAIFVLSSSIWIGGYAVLPVIARVATKELAPADRITFFRTLGRVYGVMGTAALVVALATGAGLMTQIAWGATAWATVVVAIVLLVALLIGMAQARAMTRMRRRMLQDPEDAALAQRVSREARRATWLRAALGVLTLALIGLGSVLVTSS